MYGKDCGRTAIVCLERLQGISQSCNDFGRCAALLVKSVLLLSVHSPHDGCDEKVYDVVMTVGQERLEEEEGCNVETAWMGMG